MQLPLASMRGFVAAQVLLALCYLFDTEPSILTGDIMSAFNWQLGIGQVSAVTGLSS